MQTTSQFLLDISTNCKLSVQDTSACVYYDNSQGAVPYEFTITVSAAEYQKLQGVTDMKILACDDQQVSNFESQQQQNHQNMDISPYQQLPFIEAFELASTPISSFHPFQNTYRQAKVRKRTKFPKEVKAGNGSKKRTCAIVLAFFQQAVALFFIVVRRNLIIFSRQREASNYVSNTNFCNIPIAYTPQQLVYFQIDKLNITQVEEKKKTGAAKGISKASHQMNHQSHLQHQQHHLLHLGHHLNIVNTKPRVISSSIFQFATVLPNGNLLLQQAVSPGVQSPPMQQLIASPAVVVPIHYEPLVDIVPQLNVRYSNPVQSSPVAAAAAAVQQVAPSVVQQSGMQQNVINLQGSSSPSTPVSSQQGMARLKRVNLLAPVIERAGNEVGSAPPPSSSSQDEDVEMVETQDLMKELENFLADAITKDSNVSLPGVQLQQGNDEMELYHLFRHANELEKHANIIADDDVIEISLENSDEALKRVAVAGYVEYSTIVSLPREAAHTIITERKKLLFEPTRKDAAPDAKFVTCKVLAPKQSCTVQVVVDSRQVFSDANLKEIVKQRLPGHENEFKQTGIVFVTSVVYVKNSKQGINKIHRKRYAIIHGGHDADDNDDAEDELENAVEDEQIAQSFAQVKI